MKVLTLFLLINVFLFSQESDTTNVDSTKKEGAEFPEVILKKEKPEQLPMGELFFEYKDGLQNLQTQIDSLKRVIRVIERKRAIPSINEELLNLIKIPELQHRIELANGTVVIGEIIEETDKKVIIQTSIGQLSINKDKVVKIEKEQSPAPKVELMSEPFVNVYPDREEIRGVVKNTGKTRADFVRIIVNLWTPETELAYTDSAFAKGSTQEYNTGVITDTAIKPGATAEFYIVVPIKEDANIVEYRTYDIRWMPARRGGVISER